ncbi:MAG: YhbY family RNA-binding protein [Chthoniobacterales bacterium]
MSNEEKPAGRKLKDLKARAQLLKACVSVGKAGLTDAVITALNQSLGANELVKLKFDEFKDQKKILAPEIAERTGSQLIQRVGNTAVYFRAKPRPIAD